MPDHLGSIRAVIDEDGNTVETFDYDPFGKLLRHTTVAENSKRGYTGYTFEPEGGDDFYFANARYYDAEVGRFNGIDPVKEYSSPYAYVSNNPISFVDPMGTRRAHAEYGGPDDNGHGLDDGGGGFGDHVNPFWDWNGGASWYNNMWTSSFVNYYYDAYGNVVGTDITSYNALDYLGTGGTPKTYEDDQARIAKVWRNFWNAPNLASRGGCCDGKRRSKVDVDPVTPQEKSSGILNKIYNTLFFWVDDAQEVSKVASDVAEQILHPDGYSHRIGISFTFLPVSGNFGFDTRQGTYGSFTGNFPPLNIGISYDVSFYYPQKSSVEPWVGAHQHLGIGTNLVYPSWNGQLSNLQFRGLNTHLGLGLGLPFGTSGIPLN